MAPLNKGGDKTVLENLSSEFAMQNCNVYDDQKKKLKIDKI